MNKIKLLLLIVLIMSTSLHATYIQVPSEISTIQAAINIALPYDTIMVSPGIYLENLTLRKNIKLISSSGPELTTIQGTAYRTPTISIDSSVTRVAEVNGFTITGGERSGIYIYDGSPTIRNNIITGNVNSYNFAGAGIWVGTTNGSKIEHNIIHDNFGNNSYGGGVEYLNNCKSDILSYNIFYNNGGAYAIGVRGSADSIVIYNNTITGSGSGILTYGDFVNIFNNLIFKSPYQGVRVLGGSVNLDYNCFFDNGDDYVIQYGTLDEGIHNIYANGQLIDLYNNNFNLLPFSPCINAGFQSPLYINPYDNLKDIGAIPYVFISPMPYNLSLGNEFRDHVLSHTPTFYWSYFDTMYPQAGYQIEVDTSFEWNSSAIWSSGEIYASDTEIVYAGLPLEDSVTYYYRVQVSNGIDWSEWVVSEFRMNTNPTTPIPSHPTALEYVPTSNVNLIVENSYDADSDSLVYDFELSEDILFSILSDSKYGISQQDSLTASGLFFGILPATRYYWRCRSFDGFEYSDWSETESFLTRNPTKYYVPSGYPTIQAAINVAIDNDSIIVASGTYSGLGNRDIDFGGKNIVLQSQAGADSTIIDCAGTEIENHTGFIFQNGEDSTSVINGFTITNAYSLYSGAITITNASATSILNCVISNNQSEGIAINWSNNNVYINNCVVAHNLKNGYRGYGTAIITNSIFHSNGISGAVLYYGESTIKNCTFVSNALHGLNLEGDPPLASGASESAQYGTIVQNCLTAYNGSYGIYRMFLFIDTVYCNNSFGNVDGNWSYFSPEWGFGNDSLNPMFCDTANYDFRLSSSSPCLPTSNECSALIGSYGIGCESCCLGIRGNVDYDQFDQVDISDLVYFVDFSFSTPSGPTPPCLEEADMSIDNILDISDIVFLVDFMFTNGPKPPSCSE